MIHHPGSIAIIACVFLVGCTNAACPDDRESAEGSYRGGYQEGYQQGHLDGMERVCENIKGDAPKIYEMLQIQGHCKTATRWQDPPASPKLPAPPRE
jgi:hypothetical protein